MLAEEDAKNEEEAEAVPMETAETEEPSTKRSRCRDDVAGTEVS